MKKLLPVTLLGAVSPLIASLNFSSNFIGSSANNWGWESQNGATGQLSGTDQLGYDFAGSNADAWVEQSITDTSMFPDGTGTVVIEMTVDLSNWTSGNADFPGNNIAEIAADGNKSVFNGGNIAQIDFRGFNSPGEMRFGTRNAIRFWNGQDATSPTFNVGVDPAFDLIYDLVWSTTITGNDTDGWTVESTLDVTGPMNTAGDIMTSSVTSSYFRMDGGFNGWDTTTAYRVGLSPGGNSLDAGEGILITSFSATAIPEPGQVALVLGALALGFGVLRRRR